jgi:hypothetical protein
MSDEGTTTASPDAATTPPVQADPTPHSETTDAAPIYTQEQLDKIVTERVAKSKAQFKDYGDLKTQVASIPSLQEQIQRLNTEKGEADSNFALAAKDAATLKVALDKGVPSDLVDRLRGNTPEEIAADADKLMAQFGTRKSTGGFNGGISPGGTPHTAESADQHLRAALGYSQ